MKGHIRRRSPGSWELKYDAGHDPTTGRRLIKYQTVKGTKRQAEAKLSEILHKLDEGTYLEPSKLTASDYLKSWLADHAKHRVAATTFEGYSIIVEKHLIPALGAHRLSKLSPMHVQQYYSGALTSGKRRNGEGGLSAQTVKHHHRVLSEALKQAVRLRLIGHNPCDNVDPPRPKRREMKILDQAQAARVLRAVESSPIHIPVLLAITTGVRRGENLGLRWKDVNLDGRTLSIVQTVEQTSAGIAFKAPKTERSRRTIALPSLAVEALRRHRIKQAEELLRLGIRQTDDTLVNCQPDGSPLSPRAVTDAFALFIGKLGLKVRFHDLRHTHISHLLMAGVHPKVASERAGHASVSITLDVYSHVVPGMQEDAAARIDAALRTHLER